MSNAVPRAGPMAGADHPWSAGFRTLSDEFDYRVDEIDGRVPAALRGTLFRNGAGRNDLGGHWFPHWFDGDGMISAIRFDDAGIHYLNRYVRTAELPRRDARRPHRPSRLRQDAAGRRDRQRVAPARQRVEHFGRHARRTAAVAVGRRRALRARPAHARDLGVEDFGGQVTRFFGAPEDRSAQRRAVQLRHRLRTQDHVDALSAASRASSPALRRSRCPTR